MFGAWNKLEVHIETSNPANPSRRILNAFKVFFVYAQNMHHKYRQILHQWQRQFTHVWQIKSSQSNEINLTAHNFHLLRQSAVDIVKFADQ